MCKLQQPHLRSRPSCDEDLLSGRGGSETRANINLPEWPHSVVSEPAVAGFSQHGSYLDLVTLTGIS